MLPVIGLKRPAQGNQRPKPEHAMLKGSRAKGQTAEQRRHETHLTNSSQQEGSKDLPMGAGAPAAASSEHTPRA